MFTNNALHVPRVCQHGIPRTICQFDHSPIQIQYLRHMTYRGRVMMRAFINGVNMKRESKG